MRNVIVKDRQNLIDLAIMYYGSATGVIDICQDNDLELDDVITPGMVIKLQDDYPLSADVDFADYISKSGIVIVSIKEADIEVLGTNNNEFIITNDNNYIQS